MLEDKGPMTSLKKKLYQLIIGRLDGDQLSVPSYREKISGLAVKGIGGFIVFGGDSDEVQYFISEIQSISDISLFIASDVERGVGQQLRGSTLFPCQMAISAAIDKSNPADVAILRDAVMALADEAINIGINMLLIPVLDVNSNPDNPIICTRAFSDNPESVAWFGAHYIDILESSGLISCAKHFPGHGDTSADSHILLPVIDKPYTDLINTDIMPFKEAIDKGVGSIMVGHLSVSAIDERPASLSGKIITDLLRGELGFKGLILTDALNMHALKDAGTVSVKCLKAGADILLHPIDPDMTVNEMISAVESGEIGEEQVDAAVYRILRAKARLTKTEKSTIDYRGHEQLSFHITEKSVSLLKDTPGLFPLREKSQVCVIFAGDVEMYNTSPLKKHFEMCMPLQEIVQRAPSFIPTLVSGCATFIFAIFTSVSAWKGSSGISEHEKDMIFDLMKKAENSIVISFGSPYVLRHFREADILIAAYESTEQAQKAVLRCLEGELDFRGRIPVRINL